MTTLSGACFGSSSDIIVLKILVTRPGLRRWNVDVADEIEEELIRSRTRSATTTQRERVLQNILGAG